MKKQQLKKLIKQKELELKKLHLHRSSNVVLDELYNSLILEKAVLKKDLELLERNPFIDNIKKIFSKKEKLICDYFKS